MRIRKCSVCGRDISELKPFGGPGDPAVGDFSGELLLKTWRPLAPYDEPLARAWEEAVKAVEWDGIMPWFISNYGELARFIFVFIHFNHSSSKSWECRNCIVLDDEEYFEKIVLTQKKTE